MHLDPASTSVAQSFVFTPNGLPGHPIKIPLPDSPLFIGNLYYQVTYTDAANPNSVFATNAVELRVR